MLSRVAIQLIQLIGSNGVVFLIKGFCVSDSQVHLSFYPIDNINHKSSSISQDELEIIEYKKEATSGSITSLF